MAIWANVKQLHDVWDNADVEWRQRLVDATIEEELEPQFEGFATAELSLFE